MASLTVAILVLSVVLLTAEAGGHGQGQQGGWQGGQQQQRQQQWGGMGAMERGGMGGMEKSNRGGWQGRDQEQGGQGNSRSGPNGRQGSNSNGKYRTNLLDDDDVYGYEANYPNGEVLFVNYRNNEARARRGPDFARSNSISARSRMGQMGQDGSSRRQQRGGEMQSQMW